MAWRDFKWEFRMGFIRGRIYHENS